MEKKLILLVISYLMLNTLFAQTSKQFQIIKQQSEVLNEERELKIHLPKEYDSEKLYPVLYITDAGSSNFETAKNYLEALSDPAYRLIPPSILVGVVHKVRNNELDVFNTESGRQFKKYLFEEVVPFIDEQYATSGFNAMIGHSNGAEYNQFLLLSENNPFRGFISLSTNFNTDLKAEIADFISNYKGKSMYYFVGNAIYDAPSRIQAGKDFEHLYEENPNELINFTLQTVEGSHMSMVPLSLFDGLKFIFKDYNNAKVYSSVRDYSENFLADMKDNYGIDGSYNYYDLEEFHMDMIMNKKVSEYEYFLDFVEDNGLWFGGGLDLINKANHYFMMQEYAKTIELWNEALEDIDSMDQDMFYYNIEKLIISYKKQDGISEAVEFLLKSKAELAEKYSLYMNYKIAKVAAENQVSAKEGRQAIQYCKSHYKQNRLFTLQELEELESKI